MVDSMSRRVSTVHNSRIYTIDGSYTGPFSGLFRPFVGGGISVSDLTLITTAEGSSGSWASKA